MSLEVYIHETFNIIDYLVQANEDSDIYQILQETGFFGNLNTNRFSFVFNFFLKLEYIRLG